MLTVIGIDTYGRDAVGSDQMSSTGGLEAVQEQHGGVYQDPQCRGHEGRSDGLESNVFRIQCLFPPGIFRQECH